MADFIKVNTDLHVHGLYSMAVSSQMIPKVIGEQAPLKGLQLVGTADILNGKWIKLVKEQLKDVGGGILEHPNGTKFVLQTEIEDANRVHHIILFPSWSKVEEVRERFSKKCKNLDSDGRPKIWLKGEEIMDVCSPAGCLVGFAHAFTPYFGIYSKFDSYKDCYGSKWRDIHFMELGLSADTNMADRISELHNLTFLSNSDAHCLHPNILIYLDNGYPIKIKDLCKEEMFLSVNLKDNLKIISSQAFKIFKKPSPKKLQKINILSNEIIATPEHRFFVFENGEIKEKYAQNLKRNDLVAVINKIDYEGQSKPLIALEIPVFYQVSKEGLIYLKKQRGKKKLFQREVAQKLEISAWAFNRVELGKFKLREKHLKTLARIYLFDIENFTRKYTKKELQESLCFPEKTNPRLCQLLGYLLGDGCIERGKKGNRLGASDKDLSLLKLYQELLSESFKVNSTIRPYSSQNSYRLRTSAWILKFIEENFSKVLLTKSKKRNIPRLIFDLTDKEIAAFLRGFYDAEGTVSHHSVDCVSSNLYLIKQIQALLLRLGIRSCLYKNQLEKKKQKYRHKLIIYGEHFLRSFLSQVDFGSQKKQEKLKNYLKQIKRSKSSSSADYLPIRKELIEIRKEAELPLKDLPSRLCYHLSKCNKENTLKKENVKEFIKILENKDLNEKTKRKLKVIKKLVAADINWQPVRKNEIIFSNCKYVYDLTIPQYENYVAESILVHNSPWPNKMGREFNSMLMKEVSFDELGKALKREGGRKSVLNVGFNPLEGKYHKTRCMGCLTFFEPKEAAGFNWRCPNCGKPIKKGVDFRIGELASLGPNVHPDHRPEYKHIVPLSEIIGLAMGIKNAWSEKVQAEWRKFVSRFGNEIRVLLKTDYEKLEGINPKVAEYVNYFREGKIQYVPGGGGVYGKLVPPGEAVEIKEFKEKQAKLGEF